MRDTDLADLDLAPALRVVVPADRVRTWGTEDPHLYGVDIELRDAAGAVVDTVRSYAGLRSVSIDGQAIKINGEHVFQRLVLDQGYWPESLMTAPSDAALVRDDLRPDYIVPSPFDPRVGPAVAAAVAAAASV